MNKKTFFAHFEFEDDIKRENKNYACCTVEKVLD